MSAVIPLRDVAKAMKVTKRTAKRRLKALNARVAPGLLVQFTPNGHYFADRALLLRHLPGVLLGDDEDPARATLRAVIEVKEMVQELLNRLPSL